MKSLVDKLVVIDSPIFINDTNLYVFNGIGADFYDISTTIRARETSFTIEELHSMLISNENHLKHIEELHSMLISNIMITILPLKKPNGLGVRGIFIFLHGLLVIIRLIRVK